MWSQGIQLGELLYCVPFCGTNVEDRAMPTAQVTPGDSLICGVI